MNNFPYLAMPITIGRKVFKNRIVSAPVSRSRYNPDGSINDRSYWLLEERAKGGCGEVWVGETAVDFKRANREYEEGTNYGDFEKAPSFNAFCEYAKVLKKYGSAAMVELDHCGNVRDVPDGNKPVGPVGFIRDDGVEVLGMDEELMEEARNSFATASLFMKKAGFDGVVVLSGHGWLLHQFLSARTNKRTDEYGGSLENRLRFPISVLKRIREVCGDDFILEVRVSGAENCDGGQEVEETAAYCKMMEGIVDLINISVGTYHNPVCSQEFSSMYHAKGCNAHLSEVIKKACSIPISVVGGITDPGLADQIIAEGKADMVALGRELCADPGWPEKVLNGRDDDVAKCLRCFACFPGPKEDVLNGDVEWKPKFKCTVNPLYDFDNVLAIRKMPATERSRKVLVIGGGVAGMYAAITAFDRGHQVTIIEKGPRLGGLLSFADFDADKADLRDYKDLLIRRVTKRDIKVLFNTPVSAALVAAEKPDAVIIAVGSEPLTPPIKGLENAMHALDIYSGKYATIGQNVVMVGGGMVGCETALHLAKMGKKVTVVEMLDAIASDANRMHFIGLMEEMEKYPLLTWQTGLKVTEIKKDRVVAASKDGTEKVFTCDTTVYALGMKAKTMLAEKIKALCGEKQVFVIGDCVKARRVEQAVEEAMFAAYKII